PKLRLESLRRGLPLRVGHHPRVVDEQIEALSCGQEGLRRAAYRIEVREVQVGNLDFGLRCLAQDAGPGNLRRFTVAARKEDGTAVARQMECRVEADAAVRPRDVRELAGLR